MLLEKLTYLPLAIVQATAYINENAISLSEYTSLLSDQEKDVIELLSEEFEDDGRYRNMKNPVATTWLISFVQIRRRDPLAADYLSFMACVDPKDIPQSLLPQGSSRKKQTDAIGTLHTYSFVTKHSGNVTINVHRLVHLATRGWLGKEQTLSEWRRKAIIQLAELLTYIDDTNRSTWSMYLTHAQYALNSCDNDDKDNEEIDLARKYGNCLLEDGRYNEAEGVYRRAFKGYENVLGLEHPNTLTVLNNLGSTLNRQGKYEEAEVMLRHVIQDYEKVLGPEHPSTLNSISTLGAFLSSQEKYKEAEVILQHALEG